MEVEALEHLHLLHRGLHQRAGRVGRGGPAQVLGQRAGVRADAHRRGRLDRAAHDLLDLVGAADVAGVDAHGGDARVHRLQGQRGVEVDVGDHRQRALVHDLHQRGGVGQAGDGDAHDLAAGVGQRLDLREGGRRVVRLRRRHRLDGDGRAATDRDAADVDLPPGGHRGESIGAYPHAVQTRRAFLATGAAVVLAACGDTKRPPPPRPRERVDVAVIGGGLAGLVATYRLRKAGVDARLYEGSNRLGGRAWSLREPGHALGEHGGQFVDSTHAELLSLCSQLGLETADRDRGARSRGAAARRQARHRQAADRRVRRVVGADLARPRGAVGRRGVERVERGDRRARPAHGRGVDRHAHRGRSQVGARPVARDQPHDAVGHRRGGAVVAVDPLRAVDVVAGRPAGDGRLGRAVRGARRARAPCRPSWCKRIGDGAIETQVPLVALRREGQRRRGRAGGRGAAARDRRPAGGAGAAVHEAARGRPEPRRAVGDRAAHDPRAGDGHEREAAPLDGAGSQLAAPRILRATASRPSCRRCGTSSAASKRASASWSSTRAARSAGRCSPTSGPFPTPRSSPAPSLRRTRRSTCCSAGAPGATEAGSAYLDRWADDPWTHGSYSGYTAGQWTTIAGYAGTPEPPFHFAGEHTSVWQGYMNGAVESGERAAGEIIG